MVLEYKVTNISYMTETWGMKEDIGGRKIVDYDLYHNGKKIGEFTSDNEEIRKDTLIKNFIERKILEDPSELERVMDFLDQVIPDEEFFTEICEDDFYEGRKHDLRNKNIIHDFQTIQHGSALNGTYFVFLYNRYPVIEEYYRLEGDD